MVKKFMISGLIVGVLLITGAVAASYFLYGKDDSPTQEAVAVGTENHGDRVGMIEDQKEDEYETKNLNPFGHEVSKNEMTDFDFQKYIHGMSHQKVKAHKKWGFYKLTEAKVQWLYEALGQSEVRNHSVYQQILKKWQNENFASIDQDHNTIWRLQGGTIGKASGILSPEEERAYIESR